MKLSHCDDIFLQLPVPLGFSNCIVTPFSFFFLSVLVCLYMLCGTWSLAEHSILHDAAALQSCFDTPLTQHERIATHSHSVILSLFLLFLLPWFLSVLVPPSLPVNLTPTNTWQLKCTTNRCVGTVFVGVLVKSGRGRNQE